MDLNTEQLRDFCGAAREYAVDAKKALASNDYYTEGMMDAPDPEFFEEAETIALEVLELREIVEDMCGEFLNLAGTPTSGPALRGIASKYLSRLAALTGKAE